jgi:phosphoribosylglycinamide formyltransferase 1
VALSSPACCTDQAYAFDISSSGSLASRPVDPRIAVLASGAGSNLQALLDDGRVGPCISLVVADRPGVGALQLARSRGIKAVVLEPGHYASRAAFDMALEVLLEEEAIEFVLLAGYMRILGPRVVRAFSERMLNIHPSLLPAFPGAHSVRDAIDWGGKVTGSTVHLVDEEVDHGPIVLQEAVAIMSEDDEASLHARIKEVEHRIYPRAARLLIDGKLKLEGRRVHLLDEDGSEGSG